LAQLRVPPLGGLGIIPRVSAFPKIDGEEEMDISAFRHAVRNLANTPERHDDLVDYIFKCRHALGEIRDLSTKHPPSPETMKQIEDNASAALAAAPHWLSFFK
jgi:hypothetical protein